MADAAIEIAALERLAEAAYDAMYDARPRGAKDFYDNARGYLTQAIEIAKRAGLDAEAARLTARREHIAAVWDRQFRGVGY
jgi:hypothetical protein